MNLHILSATLINNLYMLDVTNTAIRNYSLITELKHDYTLWHKRLGHIGHSSLEKLLKKNMVDGLNVNFNIKRD